MCYNFFMNVYVQTAAGLLIPFAGTTLGAASVFFIKSALRPSVQRSLLGFASGVMVAASVWSLLIPAISSSSSMGRLAFVPAAAGTALGMGFLLLLDNLIPHLHINSDKPEGTAITRKVSRAMMLFLAVTLHNIPEGMAPGVVFAGAVRGTDGVSMAGAFALAIGMAVQNFPEGAVVSLPLVSDGEGRGRAFVKGVVSGAVEPLAALLTIFLTGFVYTLMPFLLSFAAGAMLYVVVEELIPEASAGEHSNHGTIAFGAGFVLMMILDVALG